ncbi:helix-turn-helix transcriptional regulator [Sphaerisporangium sp. NPDC004334]
MVRRGQRPVPEVGFAPGIGLPPGVEVVSLAQLHARVRSGSLAQPQRPSFHHLITLHSGTVPHTADFAEYALRPGEWLWTRPGQVQRWGHPGSATGTVIMFEASFVDTETLRLAHVDDAHAPVLRVPTAAESASLTTTLELLRKEYRSPSKPCAVHALRLRQALGLLLLRLAYLESVTRSSPEPADAIFVRFRQAVERHFATSRSVTDYARRLGYSPRTLSRATEQAAGIGAKRFIDRRVVLEAQRLLAHTDRTVTQIAMDLGFPSAANFTTFFHRHAGRTALEFRQQVRDED